MTRRPRHTAAKTSWDTPVGLRYAWLGLIFLVTCWGLSRLG